METVIAFSPNHNTVFSSSAVNLCLRLTPQAGVHNLEIVLATVAQQAIGKKPT